MIEELIITVDEKDHATDVAEKMLVHQRGLLHRAFSIFIIRKKNNEPNILLQQRQTNKYHSGGLWTNTCCGHPRASESIIAAGERRLTEEMGLKIPLKEVGVFHYTASFENGLIEREIDHVLVGDYNDQLIQPNPDEVTDYCWITIEMLKKDLLAHPEKYTPWLAEALTVIPENA